MESTTELAMRYFISISLAIIITISILGNCMVFLAFKVNKYLRIVSNYFILSLAASDLITTIFVMPWDLDIILKKGSWYHGQNLCQFYTIAYLVSAPTSTMNLLAVSINRYWLIRDPFAYKRQTTPFRAMMMIAAIWLYSSLMAFIPLMGWKNSTSWPTDPSARNCTNLCFFDIATDYSIMMSVLNFVIPPLIMTFIYYKIYEIARGHIRRIHRLESGTFSGRESFSGMVNSTNNSRRSSRAGSCSPIQLETHVNGNHTYLSPQNANCKFLHIGKKDQHISYKCKHENKNSAGENAKYEHAKMDTNHAKTVSDNAKKNNEHAKMDHEHARMDNELEHMDTKKAKKDEGPVKTHLLTERRDSTHAKLDFARKNSIGKRKPRAFSVTGTSMLRKNVKAAKSLAIIVGTFFLCWYPYTIVSMVSNAIVSQPPLYVHSILLVFGYLNSMLNPFLYGFHNKEFKKTYKKILRLK